MMKTTIFLTLIGLCAAISCCATELPVLKYIDVDNIDKTFDSQRIFFRDFAEKYGGETAEETARSLEELTKNIKELLSGQEAEDEFDLRAKFDADGLKNLQKYLQPLSDIARDPENNTARCNLRLFLDTIKAFFGNDLHGFAEGKVTHDAKLHAFLLKYIRSIVSFWIDLVVLSREHYNGPHEYMERLVAHDLPKTYFVVNLIARAQRMDLARDTFDAKAMLAALDKVDVGTENFVEDKKDDYLYTKLEEVCRELDLTYGASSEIYTWTRLVAPEKMPHSFRFNDIFRLNEYWRVCLPLLNPETRIKVAENIKRNMNSRDNLFG